MKNLTIYVSGGMTGYKDFNYPKFNKITKKLRELGYNVVNPGKDVNPILSDGRELTIDELHKWQSEELAKCKTEEEKKAINDEVLKEFLRGDIIALQFCNAVYRLKNWKNSKGARYEVSCARRMKYKMFDEGKETDLLSQVA